MKENNFVDSTKVEGMNGSCSSIFGTASIDEDIDELFFLGRVGGGSGTNGIGMTGS